METIGLIVILAALGAFGYFIIWPKIKAKIEEKE